MLLRMVIAVRMMQKNDHRTGKTLHDGATVSLRGNLIDHKGDDRYVFRDKSGEINVIIPSAVFDGREVQPDQMININGSLDKKAKEPLVRVNRLQK